MNNRPSYLHPLPWNGEELPTQFTYPFRYTPHPLCRRAALLVQEKLKAMRVREGKMYGVLVAEEESALVFLAAYSGQLCRSYNHPWFVPPVVDYLDPESYFQKEQTEIVGLSRKMDELRASEEIRQLKEQLATMKQEREAAVAEAKRVYAEGKAARQTMRGLREVAGQARDEGGLVRESQHQKADIQRAKQLHKDEIADIEEQLRVHNATLHDLYEERKHRSEALQHWLFEQFEFLNAKGEKKGLLEIFKGGGAIPSGAGECCAPKLLQAAYQLGLKPLAMAEFWWGGSKPGHYREQGAFFPACRSKCYPILGHMLQGLDVEPDPALHYDNKVLAPVRVVWEDEHLAVIFKPNGWCSIPGKSDQANIIDEAHRIWPDIQGSVVVHRLDQDTSGVMVIAKNSCIHRALGQQFERREVHKRYVALVEGRLRNINDSGGEHIIDLPIGPDLDNMPHQIVNHENGKEAVTRWKVLGEELHEGQDVTRIVLYPQTGRTHQLRVHAASKEGLGTPILGDRLYGHVSDRLYLHAEAIDFVHPVMHERMHFEVPAPF